MKLIYLKTTALCTLFLPLAINAQLLDQEAAGPNATAPLSTISKNLQEQVGSGQGDVNTPGSSIYLIKRDPARSIRRGRQLFQRKFSTDQGLGPRVNPMGGGDIVANRALGAGLIDSCAGCHGRPRGAAGFGGVVATRPDSRDAPHLFGLGIIEQLADEMTTELRAQRSAALALTGKANCKRGSKKYPFDLICHRNGNVTVNLTAKGISFGSLTARANGKINTTRVEGVDSNLRVKPFFHEGGTASIREFAIGAFSAEMGLQSADSILCQVTDPTIPQSMTSPSGFVYDPTLDTFERPPICDASLDGDNDGVINEIDPALIDHMEFYLLNYFKPGQYKVTQRAKQGLGLMKKIGCTGCHVQNLTIESDRRVADVETVYDPLRGIFNQLFATAATQFTPFDDGDEFPQLLPTGDSFVVKNIFSDLKRHDLGPAFHEREYNDDATNGANRVTEFVTEPLWGVATSAPYGHDGRSINLDQVIRRHGGEAQAVTEAYVKLSDNQQNKIIEFLQTLVLFPPDDTASNLNPGNPNTQDPQNPAEHGNINLGALFQISSEGGE